MSDFKYVITERIAVLSEKKGWTKELNMVSWNDRPVKFDLREWHHEDGKIGKGTTLTDDEIRNLREVLNAIEI